MEDYSSFFNSENYIKNYHNVDISSSIFLVTGGAGFIGSNIVEYLLKYNAGNVRVLDNLSNGYYENIEKFIGLKNFEFIKGDIRDYTICENAIKNVDYVIHQAALGSVPRSINDPLTTNEVNISGFINMLTAAKQEKSVKRFVYAASSSTYGDSKILPKVENIIGSPLSPYAVTKYVNELYAEVFSKVYNIQLIGLRYFNVFGFKQNPNNPYAAVIPLFIKSALTGNSPKIFGDGETSRDFTFIENVVQANIKALFSDIKNKSEIFNIACGNKTTLNELWEIICREFKVQYIKPTYFPERNGDIKHSLANIDKAKKELGYNVEVNISEGIAKMSKYKSL
jgi:UDP-N-acetylglucosamine 4-epimerase